MTVDQTLLVAVSVVFVLVTGANDGSALLSVGLPMTGLRTFTATVILVLLTMLVPLTLGTTVATTFTHRLVGFTGSDAEAMMAIAVLSCLVVVIVLTFAGLPTSLTLAVIGGVVGVGLGAGEAVDWPVVTTVLAIGVAAPVAGAIIAYLIAALYRLVPPHRLMSRTVVGLHRVAFTVQCVAYSLNDGQKMLAVLAVAFGATTAGQVEAQPQLLAIMGGGFAVGTLLGLPRVGMKLSNGLFAVRAPHTVAAELASGAAVLGSAAVGAPVSMTQSLTGGLLGAGVRDGSARVRWKAVVRMGMAWAITLPTTAAAGLIGGLILHEVRS